MSEQEKKTDWLMIFTGVGHTIMWAALVFTICTSVNSCTTTINEKIKESHVTSQAEPCDCDKCDKVEGK